MCCQSAIFTNAANCSLFSLIDRIQQDKTSIRPLALGKTREEIKALLAQRLSWYEESATHRINTTNETPEKIIDTIIERIKSI